MNQRLFKCGVALCVFLGGASIASAANVAPSVGHGFGGGHEMRPIGRPVGPWHGGGPGWWGWGLGLGLGLGLEAEYLANPWLYYPYPGYYYPYPGYYYPYSPPAEYVEPQAPTAAPPPPANWYYCDSARAYYPYVTKCPEAWRVVPAAPPAPAQ